MPDYGKYLPPRLRQLYEDAKKDPDLLSLKPEIRLIEARLQELEDLQATGEDVDRLSMSIAQLKEVLQTARDRQAELEEKWGSKSKKKTPVQPVKWKSASSGKPPRGEPNRGRGNDGAPNRGAPDRGRDE